MLLAANFWFDTLAPHTTATEHINFLWGLLHGLLVVPNFVYSLFNDRVTIYQAGNDGVWYNLGFLLGIGAFAGGAARTSN